MSQSEEIRIQYQDEIPRGARIKVIGVGGGGGNAVNRMQESQQGAAGMFRVITIDVSQRAFQRYLNQHAIKELGPRARIGRCH